MIILFHAKIFHRFHAFRVYLDTCTVSDVDANAATSGCDTLTAESTCSVSCNDGYHSDSNPSLTLTCPTQGGSVSASAFICVKSMYKEMHIEEIDGYIICQ